MRFPRLAAATALLVFVGCTAKGPGAAPPGVNAANHTFFPIGAGAVHEFGRTLLATDPAVSCDGCHPSSADSFKALDCASCHAHAKDLTARLHLTVDGYASDGQSCLKCHPSSDHKAFDHGGVADACAACHAEGAPFAALPKEGFTHPDRGALDCSGCHTSTKDWTVVAGGAQDKADPTQTVTVRALVPTWSGTSIVAVTSLTETLPMLMVHGSGEVDPGAMSGCANCHAGAASGAFYPGRFHSSLANLTITQPTSCGSCHAGAMPTGFVGAMATTPPRLPPSPEMKHDAVAWANGAPTSLALIPADCGVCHLAPAQLATPSDWTTSRTGTGSVSFHAALSAAGRGQPGSCLDCHANARPASTFSAPGAALPPGLSFDHTAQAAQGDCAACHSAGAAGSGFKAWTQGLFHTSGSATPATCLPCHASERPTTTSGWVNPTWQKSPFDAVTNAKGVTHGAGLDCVVCHANPGTGQWGAGHNWAAGRFAHGPGTPAAQGCVQCHSTQRPDLVLGVSQANTAVGFDHSLNGAGDCFGCHQATVKAGTYVAYFNPTTGTLPNGDWKNGAQYPGDTLSSSTDQFITLTETQLHRSGANNLVTSATTTTATIPNGMLHTSAQVPAALSPGPTGANTGVCWHCHTSTGTTVTAFSNGQYHTSLTNYRPSPDAGLAPLPQPTTGCTDCHVNGLPADIVERSGSTLLAMDHSAQFTAPVTLGGVSVTAVSQADCSVCHKKAGNTWADGVFHASIGGAVPKDCVGCHWLLMADGTKADLPVGADVMKHRSVQLTTQGCQLCHASALAKAATTPAAATLWATGALHAGVPSQPAACVDCHQGAQPAAATQSTERWTFTLSAGTGTNEGQWMTHTSLFVAGRDCAVCHAADAKPSGAAWNRGAPLHGPVTGVTSCAGCHGTANGNGAVAGARNNLPGGVSASTTVTSASAASGVAGALDQIDHADVNVAGKDCALCHLAPDAGSWASAAFHASIGGALVTNGTTGRCAFCHFNLKPTGTYTQQDHSSFLRATGKDCSACHSYPGTSASAPNWLGAKGAPTTISVGGFQVASPPADAGVLEPGLDLPHPVVGTQACTACHVDSAGSRPATGYDHASTLIGTACNACHEAGSDLVGTPWNGAGAQASGAGDTRPFTLTSVVAQHGANLTVTFPKHFFPVDCSECHLTPGLTGATTTGAAYQSAWAFPHTVQAMTNPSTCLMCHTTGIPGAPDGGVADPARAVTVSTQVPRFAGTSIVSVSAQTQTLPMTMVHASKDVPAAANSACTNCHLGATTGAYFPGELHSSLANLALAQPTACASCHAGAWPTGFVGPTATTPPRTPATSEMRHEAVAWVNGSPGTTGLVSSNCGQCHAAPSATLSASWATAPDAGAVRYHASLSTQPASCLDCHANSRPSGALAAGAGVTFDHLGAMGDCQACHAKSTQGAVTSWAGGLFHLTGSTSPTTCLPCHSGERPTSAAGWKSATYTQAPFDYGTNAQGVTHGDGLDCVSCHAGPGTGAWGGSQNWQGGAFNHVGSTVAANGCLACHASQRPDLVLGASQANTAVGFDHAVNGTGDCVGCHQATVTAGTYARYFNQATGTLPNGDWKGGIAYPGSRLATAPTQLITLTEYTLVKTGPLVTGLTSHSASLNNSMLHVSAALPASLNAGPTASPDYSKCWHCHTHPANSTTVSSYANGQYHSALTSYQATLGGAVTPLAQPTARCNDCHVNMYPTDIVEKAASDLQPMDHAATFTSAVTLGGASVTAVNQVDCSVCHKSPGSSWADGLFHANIGAAQPSSCLTCHYPVMADATAADVTSGVNFKMKHGSSALTFQACETCHVSALGAATTATHAATLWATGNFHGKVSAQPGLCVECHQVSEPAAGASTQSSVTYTLALGGTATNGGQWLNHGSSYVAGKDCVVCHAADAKSSGSAWSKADLFHPTVTGATLCNGCHGTTNGKGTVLGTNNNLPVGVTNSSTLTSAGGVAGISASTPAGITHADVNVSGLECVACHTQQGASSVAGIKGKEWAVATFHAYYSGATALTMNGTTGRCSSCHLAEKPNNTLAGAPDHTALTSASGSKDCAPCHAWPGTGTASSPNWLGAKGAPDTIYAGGFTVPKPPASSATTEASLSLTHPTASTCTSCHSTAGGSAPAIAYDHLASGVSTNCNACHEAGSTHVATPWNGSLTISGGAGDTRPFTATSLTATKGSDRCSVTNANHFYPTDCHQCHKAPAGIVGTTTGTTYGSTNWKFNHNTGNMTNSATCKYCHPPCPD